MLVEERDNSVEFGIKKINKTKSRREEIPEFVSEKKTDLCLAPLLDT